MSLVFDVAADELDLLLAETNEHLHHLETGLLQLEQERQPATGILQEVFRAAHTLKGMAGMINHPRMAALTHALETVFDGWRKSRLAVAPALVETCLQALDALKLLRDEIATNHAQPIDIEPLVAQLAQWSPRPMPPVEPSPTQIVTPTLPGVTGQLAVQVEIAPTSAIPAARALQILLALQTLGLLVSINPPAEEIEVGIPARLLTATLAEAAPVAQILQTLCDISEVSRVVVGDQQWEAPSEAEPTLPAPNLLSDALPPSNGNGATTTTTTTLQAEKTVRTSVERLDRLMNLVGELITDRNRLHQLQSDLAARHRADEGVEDLGQTVVHLSRITDQLQEEVMHTRLVPIVNVFNKFPRLVRDLAHKAGKQVEMVIRGQDTELDRSMIEIIGDPLIHLLRNAVDHGLELPSVRQAQGKPAMGVLRLTARHEENHIIITVEDDGAGLDLAQLKQAALQRQLLTEAEAATLTREETIQLIFRPGLSTATTVSEVSGRGVGMDIVRANIERLNGNILVETWAGHGTRFQIILPLTLAIIPALLVRAEDPRQAAGLATFAIPLVMVMEVLRLPRAEISTVGGRPMTQLREHLLPLTRLSTLLGLNGPEQPYHLAQPSGPLPTRAHENVVAVRWGKLPLGLLVDSLIGEQEVVVKPLGSLMGDTPGVSGASILGDGRVALIVDVPSLFQRLGI